MASERASQRPFFLAHDLAAARELRRVDEEGLARLLGCAEDDLVRASLCRSPSRGDGFRADVERIATQYRIPGDRLGGLLREVDAIAALRSTSRERFGWLAAARDEANEDDVDD